MPWPRPDLLLQPSCAFVLCLAQPAAAFDPVKDIAMVLTRGALHIQIPDGVHVKIATFKVALRSGQGTIKVRQLPSSGDVDESGDPVWRGRIRVLLQSQHIQGPVELEVVYQPCTEGKGSVCYLPQHRFLPAKPEDLVAEP